MGPRLKHHIQEDPKVPTLSDCLRKLLSNLGLKNSGIATCAIPSAFLFYPVAFCLKGRKKDSSSLPWSMGPKVSSNLVDWAIFSYIWSLLCSRASQIFCIFGHTVFCVLLNERKLMRPSLGRLEVIFDGCQASKADQSRGWSRCQLWRPGHHRRWPPIYPNWVSLAFSH